MIFIVFIIACYCFISGKNKIIFIKFLKILFLSKPDEPTEKNPMRALSVIQNYSVHVGDFTCESENYRFIKMHLKLIKGRQRCYLPRIMSFWETVSLLKI